MSAVMPLSTAVAPHSEGVWRMGWRRFRGDRIGMVSLCIVAAFMVLIALSATRLVSEKLLRETSAGRPSPGSRLTHGVGASESTQVSLLAPPRWLDTTRLSAVFETRVSPPGITE